MLPSKDLLGRYTSAGGVNTYQARGCSLQRLRAGQPGADQPRGRRDRLVRHVLPDTFPIGCIPALIPPPADGWPTFGTDGVVPVNGPLPQADR